MGARIARLATALGLLFGFLSPIAPAGAAHSSTKSLDVPIIRGSAGILIDSTTQGGPPTTTVLWEKASTERRGIASLTKIVTALVVIERSRMDDLVTASVESEAIGASDPLVTELELRAGEQLTVRSLLYGLLLISANDAAVALAEHVSGSVESFVALMNREAMELGATNTRFLNPHGFDQEGHYSTAADISKFALALMGHDELRKMVATKNHEIRRSFGTTTELVNRNVLLGSLEGADGIKTGQTRASGMALVASATRGNESRIAVVLGSTDSFADASALLDYGFAGFRRFKVAHAGSTWGYATLGDGRTMRLVPRGNASYLIGAEEPDPQVRYDPRKRAIVVSLFSARGRPTSVQLDQSCVGPCESEGSRGLGWLWEVLSPIARVITAL